MPEPLGQALPIPMECLTKINGDRSESKLTPVQSFQCEDYTCDCLRIEVPMLYEDAHGQQCEKWVKHPVLLPHEVVGAFHRFRPVDLMSRLTGGPGVLSEFWSHEVSTEWYRQHPVFQAHDPELVIPLRLFGDGAESHRKQKFEILTLILPVISSSSSSATMDTRILLSCMSSSYCNDGARRRILETIAWSFNCLSIPYCIDLLQHFAI